MAISLIETASLDTGLVAPTATALTTASGSAPSYSARAWVNFNGTGTVAIRASGNVTSITDNGTRNYTVNFTTAMADVNYTVNCTAGVEASTLGLVSTSTTTPTASAYRFRTTDSASNVQDSDRVMVSVFR